ncbi:MAG TPA: aromatic aminobenezylarsenical efflux permease ArsG family transporter [Bacteroidales bacterium]|jgi:cytochrome c biogenesis protein CcdA|nr:aromatic aminobenezylarsenical efflux permease ArsG family transporter [Bacteroidales bacterium]
MEYLQHLLDNAGTPFLTAIILGFMTAISPCPLATNITAIGFISKDIENKQKIFINGLIYTLGRALSYTVLGIVLYFGASKFHVAKVFQVYGERLLGPLLILIGIFMLDLIKIKFPAFNKLTDKLSESSQKGSSLSALLLGIVFALAFCPYSGMLYFGMLVPISIASPSGLYLPVVYAFVTGLPVIIIAWLLAYSVSSIGNFYNKLKAFEKWFRIIVVVLFIAIGLYYVYIFFVK